MPTERFAHRVLARARRMLFVLPLLALQCGTTREDPSGGETHFFTCDTDRDCAWLAPSHSCRAGYCRTEGAPPPPCSTSIVPANAVVILGDSFFAANHLITGFLEERARASGALAPGERYRDASRVTANTLALTGPGVQDQYAGAAEEGGVEVVIMTGGGADVLLGSCESVNAECELLVAATDAARALFQRMATDGVRQIVYVFYPDPADAALRAEVDALRPLLETACAQSPVPCHWVDLRESFSGHEPTYLDASGTTPTSEGAQAAAAQIWSVMTEQCIAQAP